MKQKGFTLIELLISSAIATIVMGISFALILNVYFVRKQINIAQNFYSESRFILEKIVNMARENTIDYDRYFIEIGPDKTICNSFSNNQGGPNHPGPMNKANNNADPNINKQHRTTIGYKNIFYWKISDNIYRNLGGMNINGIIDPCTQTFHNLNNTSSLFLINKERNIRTAIKNNILGAPTDTKRIQFSIELGADTNNDGLVDAWGWSTKWEGGICNLYNSLSALIGPTIIQEEKACNLAHPFENFSAKKLRIENFSFTPYPDRDPFLSFRNDSSQIHPNIFLFMKIDLENAQSFGFESTPTITMQTNVSSRIFDNTRK